MPHPKSRARLLVAVALVSLPVAAACESTQGPKSPIVATSTSASTSESPSVSSTASSTTSTAADPDGAAAWTEPAVVDALAKDCAWHPKGYVEGKLSDEKPQALGCDVPWSQSCAYDPCITDDCESACAKSCDGCDVSCTGSCDTCKKSCTGADADKCRATCAVSCGACKQTCRTSRDTCATSECQKKSETCWTNAEATWKKNHCSCKKIGACLNGCGAGDMMMSVAAGDDKAKKCWDACTKKIPGCDFQLCITTMGNEPFEKKSPSP